MTYLQPIHQNSIKQSVAWLPEKQKKADGQPKQWCSCPSGGQQ